MKTYSRVFLLGFLLWLTVCVVSFVIFPLKKAGSPLFETLIALALTLFTVFFSIVFFKKLTKHYLQYGIKVGIIWFLINVVIDLCLFSWGPMKMSFVNYMEDIGFTYLVIPIITVGYGYLLEKTA